MSYNTLEIVATRLIEEFGFQNDEDWKQEIWYHLLYCESKYGLVREHYTLEEFLYKHVKNRIYSIKRNRYDRPRYDC